MGKSGLFEYIGSTSFVKFLSMWLVSIFVFGLVYWILSGIYHGLSVSGNAVEFSVAGFVYGLHASFLLATLLGITLVSKIGIFNILGYIQIFFSVMLILILVDKLFQKFIVGHYHTTTKHDKRINTIMLMMSIFKTDIDRIRHEFGAKTKHHINIKDIEATIDGLYVSFIDVEHLFSARNAYKHLIKDKEYVMIVLSIEESLERLLSFIEFLNNHGIDWKDKSVEFWIRYMLETADKIAMHIDGMHTNRTRLVIAAENIRDYCKRIEEKL